MNYKNIKEALEQLEKCKFTDEIGHPLENNTAFIYLKELGEKFPMLIGDEVEVEVFGEIAGIKTSVKQTGKVNKMVYSCEQPDGNTSAKYIITAEIGKLAHSSAYARNNPPFEKKRIWIGD